VFTIYNDSERDETIVSNLFIDEYMKDANDAQIKIYLYLLRMMSAGKATSISDMADQFNHTEKDVLRSLRYWEKKGLLSLDFDAGSMLTGIRLADPHRAARTCHEERVISITPMLSVVAGSGSAPAASSAVKKTPAPAKTDLSNEALEAFRADKKRAELLFIIEQYIGKPLSVNEIRTVYYISEDLHFSGELIDYLVQYCVDRGKKDFRYIEKVAVNWASDGITTPRQAQARAAQPAAKGRKINQFNQFEQNHYDFKELEKDILKN
jgi:DnaD/phage-associated family protein